MSEPSNETGMKVSVEGMDDLWNVWYSELHEGNTGWTMKIDVLESFRSDIQRIDVVKNPTFGKMLVLYGSLMIAENDNNAYNEMLAQVPLFSHPDPRQVLIIGGGDCGCLTEVLKHKTVEQCTMCEIDREVVETAKRHFPAHTAGLDDERANVIFEDGKAFIENTEKKFDIILLDLSDPIGPAAELFQKPFHQDVCDRLNDNGILVAQAESPLFNETALKAMHTNLSDIFPTVRVYTCYMPIYPSGHWAFLYASKGPDPIKGFDQQRWDKLGIETRYYNPETHAASFALPQFVKKIIE